MDDPQSSNPLEAVLDAGSEVVGNAIGALLDPFGSITESSSADDTDDEQDATEQVDASAGDNEDGQDEDNDSDDDYDDYYDEGGEQTGEYTAAPQYQMPAMEATRYYKSDPSESPKHSYQLSKVNAFSNRSSGLHDTSDSGSSDLFSGLSTSILLGLFLYPVIGLGGCITRLVAQGPPPHPMYQEQAHDQWLNSPVQSWTTEAVIIPLAIIAITFFRRLIKVRHASPISYVLLLVGGVATIAVGIGLMKSLRKDSRGTSTTVNASGQAVGTTREVNALKLNMRSGPGSNYPVVLTLSKKTRLISYGETVQVNGELWTQASTPDGKTRGWVNRKFLSP